jgi:hypothetical protein
MEGSGGLAVLSFGVSSWLVFLLVAVLLVVVWKLAAYFLAFFR